MFKWIKRLADVLIPEPSMWQCHTHGSWIRIIENDKMVYTGEIDDAPQDIKRRYDGYMAAVKKMEDEIDKICKQFGEFENVQRAAWRRS